MEFKEKNEYKTLLSGHKKMLCKVNDWKSIEQKRGL
jgi:hypothetical protein